MTGIRYGLLQEEYASAEHGARALRYGALPDLALLACRCGWRVWRRMASMRWSAWASSAACPQEAPEEIPGSKPDDWPKAGEVRGFAVAQSAC